MPNSEHSGAQENKDQDSFNEERLDSKSKNKSFEEAKRANPDSFKSFSDGLEAVDKFDIVGEANTEEKCLPVESDTEDSEENIAQDKKANQTKLNDSHDGSFQSFSDGLDSVDKFSISGAAKLDSRVQYLPLIDYLNHDQCLASSNNLEKKSQTLDELIERIKRCSWAKDTTVFIHPVEHPCEYDLREHHIHIDMTKSKSHQIMDFSHQLYHAAHRYLTKLYIEGPLEEELFLDTFYWSEAGALLTELNVKQELSLQDAPEIGYKVKLEKNKYKQMHIEPILNSGGLDSLREALTQALARDDFVHKQSLKAILTTFHQNYLRTFEGSQDEAKRQIRETISNGIDSNKI